MPSLPPILPLVSRRSRIQVPVPFLANAGQTNAAVACYAPTFAGTVFVTRTTDLFLSATLSTLRFRTAFLFRTARSVLWLQNPEAVARLEELSESRAIPASRRDVCATVKDQQVAGR